MGYHEGLTEKQWEKFTDLADNMSNDELTDAFNYLRDNRAEISDELRGTFNVGDTVKFEDKDGDKQVGKITEIMAKNIKVVVDYTTWRVSPEFLTITKKQARKKKRKR